MGRLLSSDRATDPLSFGTSSDESSKRYLFGETARQRQLESIHGSPKVLQAQHVDLALCTQLLAAFWNRQHSSVAVVYRPLFMRDMTSGGPYFSTPLLNAIFFVATKDLPALAGQCPSTDICGDGMSFRAKVEAELYDPKLQLLTVSQVTTAQAVLLMSDALHAWCDEKSLAWHYLGIAIGMIIDLGIHTTRSAFYHKGSLEEQEAGRRVFWAAYVRDKQQAIYLGRPARLRASDSNIPISFLDDYDELDPFNTLTYAEVPGQLSIPSRSISCSEQLCKLSIIAESILSTLYSEQSYMEDPQSLFQSSGSLQAKLDSWYNALPAHLSVRQGYTDSFDILPHSLSLIAMYHSLTILLHRPFVSEGHLQHIAGSSSTAAFGFCAQAANGIDTILRVYQEHFCLKSCPYFLSYATYASGTIHVRLAAQSSAASRAHQALCNCLDVLQEQQIRCHAPRQSMKMLLSLVERLGVNIGRKYKAEISRSQAFEGETQLGQAADLSSGATNNDQMAWMNSNVDLGDLDIDAIIQSFDANSSRSTDNATSAVSGGMNSGSLDIESTAMGGYPFKFQVESTDPLFGIDALLSDGDWMSAEL